MIKNRNLLAVAISASLIVLGGCEFNGKVTGGGHMDSATGEGKANYGFRAEQCGDDFAVKGNFNYHDMNAGVKMKGDVTNAGLCDSNGDIIDLGGLCQGACFDGEHEIQFTYDSTNPAAPGAGDGFACVSDGGEGSNQGGGTFGTDSVYVQVNSGPFGGYANFQIGVGGNIQDHECPEDKGNSDA